MLRDEPSAAPPSGEQLSARSLRDRRSNQGSVGSVRNHIGRGAKRSHMGFRVRHRCASNSWKRPVRMLAMTDLVRLPAVGRRRALI